MGGASRHPGISCSRTGAVLGWWLVTFHKHTSASASRGECAYRSPAFVLLRTASNRCNTAERTRQYAGRKGEIQSHSQSALGSKRASAPADDSRWSGTAHYHHAEVGSGVTASSSPPPPLLFWAWKWCFCNTSVIFLSAWGHCRFLTFFFLNILFRPPFSPSHKGGFHAKTLLLLHSPCKINAAPSVGRVNCTAAPINSQLFRCFLQSWNREHDLALVL